MNARTIGVALRPELRLSSISARRCYLLGLRVLTGATLLAPDAQNGWSLVTAPCHGPRQRILARHLAVTITTIPHPQPVPCPRYALLDSTPRARPVTLITQVSQGGFSTASANRLLASKVETKQPRQPWGWSLTNVTPRSRLYWAARVLTVHSTYRVRGSYSLECMEDTNGLLAVLVQHQYRIIVETV